MSFNNAFTEDLETASVASVHYNDFPEFESISQSIETTLHHINKTYLASLRSSVREYESIRESGETEQTSSLSRKLVELTAKCTESFKLINDHTQKLNAYLNECELNHEDEDTLKYLRHKEQISLNLVRSSLRQFQSYQRKIAAFESQSVERGQAYLDAASDNIDGSRAPGQEQQQIQITYEPINAEELEQQTLMVEEREREIQQISQDTREINEIFSNLQDIIQEQQFQVDTIEENILSYGADAQGAARELRRAERYQKRSGGRMLCCLLILIGVFGSVILIGVIF